MAFGNIKVLVCTVEEVMCEAEVCKDGGWWGSPPPPAQSYSHQMRKSFYPSQKIQI